MKEKRTLTEILTKKKIIIDRELEEEINIKFQKELEQYELETN